MVWQQQTQAEISGSTYPLSSYSNSSPASAVDTGEGLW